MTETGNEMNRFSMFTLYLVRLYFDHLLQADKDKDTSINCACAVNVNIKRF